MLLTIKLRMLCIQTLIVLLLPPHLEAFYQTWTTIKSYIYTQTKLRLCGIGVCGHLELHLGDGCCWVKSLGAGLGTLIVSYTFLKNDTTEDVR